MRVHKSLLAAAAVALVITAGAALWPRSVASDANIGADALTTAAVTDAAPLAAPAAADPGPLDSAHRTPIAGADEAEPAPPLDKPAGRGELVVWVQDGEGAPVARAQIFRAVPVGDESNQGVDLAAAEITLNAPGPTGPGDQKNAIDMLLRQAFAAQAGGSSPRGTVSLAFGQGSGNQGMTLVLSGASFGSDDKAKGRNVLSGLPILKWSLGDGGSRESAPVRLELLGKTGRDGGCRLPCTGALTLLASTASGATSGLVDLDVPDAGAEVVLVVRPNCRVQGVVVDAAGQPLAEAKLEAVPLASRVPRARSVRDVTSDARGAFALGLDAPFAYRVQAVLGDQRSEELRLETVSGNPLTVRIRMPGAVTFMGVVQDPNGVLVAGADVSLTRLDRDPAADPRVPQFVAHVSSDDAGAFRVLVPSVGVYGAVARHGDWAHSPLERLDAQSAGVRAVRLQLRTPCAMFGSVRWRDGTAIAGAQVTLTARAGEVPAGLSADEVYGAAVTAQVGDDGSYRFDRLLPGVGYDLRCVPDATRSHTRVVRCDLLPSQQDFVLDRDALRGASLRLSIEPSNHAQIGSANILVSRRGKDGTWMQAEGQDATCARPNEIEVDGLERGVTYAVELRAPDFGRCRTEPFVAGVDRERVVRPQPSGRLEVVVLDGRGRPVLGAQVVAREQAPPGLGRADSIKFTDVRGVVEWSSISVLPWSIWAEQGDQRSPVTPVGLASNATTRVELRLPAAATR